MEWNFVILIQYCAENFDMNNKYKHVMWEKNKIFKFLKKLCLKR